MSNHLKLRVPNAESSAGWLHECTLEERGLQIAAAFSPKASVQLVGYGDQRSGARELLEANFTFTYQHFEQAASEFLLVGQQLNFPSNTRLIHVISDRKSFDCTFNQLAMW